MDCALPTPYSPLSLDEIFSCGNFINSGFGAFCFLGVINYLYFGYAPDLRNLCTRFSLSLFLFQIGCLCITLIEMV